MLTTAYPAPITSSAITLASITRARRGVARKVPVIVLWRYSDPIWMTPMVSSSR